MLGDDPPVFIHDLTAFAHQRGGVAPHETAGIAGGREAELLRIGLRRDRQPEPLAIARVSVLTSPPIGKSERSSSRCPSMWSM